MERPATRYARSGEVSIAYQSIGEGARTIIICPGFVSNVEVIGELFASEVRESGEDVEIGEITFNPLTFDDLGDASGPFMPPAPWCG